MIDLSKIRALHAHHRPECGVLLPDGTDVDEELIAAVPALVGALEAVRAHCLAHDDHEGVADGVLDILAEHGIGGTR